MLEFHAGGLEHSEDLDRHLGRFWLKQRIGRDAAQIRAGVSAQLSRAFAVYVYYDGIVGRRNYNSNGASGGFSFSF